MELLRASSEDEMVLAFLTAEWGSPRWRSKLEQWGLSAALLTSPNLDDGSQNRVRKQVLSTFRGYGEDSYLFAGFPADVSWNLVRVSVGELGDFSFSKETDLMDGDGNALSVRVLANDLDEGHRAPDAVANIADLDRKVAAGLDVRSFGWLIAAKGDDSDEVILVEGHSRATVLMRHLPESDSVDLLLGRAKSLSGWSQV